ncbi:MAG TPA: class III extradiol ring-cleavage dioxygenase [Anaeromyxobacteraceae bacterium]|nr:class III extradiol ring-cleavage dioxygenase [Anaeromyxobacteraceae bacterium]
MTRAPVLFVSHGAPTVALEQDDYALALRAVGQRWPEPAAIAVVSAHFQTHRGVVFGSAARNRVHHDFGGFPEPLYRLDYPARGAPELALEAEALARAAGFRTQLDPGRTLDHGAWIPLRLGWPAAPVPVFEVSLPDASPAELVTLGRALRPLRDRGVLLLASGGVVHNLLRTRLDAAKDAPPEAWASGFDAWVGERLAARDLPRLLRYREEAPDAALAAPSSEHFDPLFVALGAAHDDERVETFYDQFHYGTLGMRSFALVPDAPAKEQRP